MGGGSQTHSDKTDLLIVLHISLSLSCWTLLSHDLHRKKMLNVETTSQKDRPVILPTIQKFYVGYIQRPNETRPCDPSREHFVVFVVVVVV